MGFPNTVLRSSLGQQKRVYRSVSEDVANCENWDNFEEMSSMKNLLTIPYPYIR